MAKFGRTPPDSGVNNNSVMEECNNQQTRGNPMMCEKRQKGEGSERLKLRKGC